VNAVADPPTDVRQQTLVKFAVGQVERAARDVVRRYGPALKPRELYAVGTFALYRAARDWREEMNDDFQDFAYRRIRTAMRDDSRKEGKHHRRMRAAQEAGDEFLANLRNDVYNPFDHNDDDAERFLQEHADDLLTATFVGLAEEMQSEAEAGPEGEDEHRHTYEALAVAMRRLPTGSAHLLRRLYRDRAKVDDLASELGVAYRTVQNRHYAALAALREHLVALGVDRAPRLRPGEVGEGVLAEPQPPPPGADGNGKVVPFAPRPGRAPRHSG